jgi:hypothetical protein
MGGALGLSIMSGVAASVTASSANLGARAALVHGYDRAMLVSVAFLIFAILIAIFVIHANKPKQPESAIETKQKVKGLALASDL